MRNKLDLKDRKILFQLDNNARQSISILAKKVGLSRQVVEYRIKRLENEGIIQDYTTLINFSKLGYHNCRIFMNLKNMNRTIEKELINYISNIRQCIWLSFSEGKWDFICVIMVKSIYELDDIYKEILFNFSKNIEDTEVSIAKRINHYLYKFLLFDKNQIYPQFCVDEKDSIYDVDKREEKILDILRYNARISILDISKKTKIDIKTIRKKIKKLEKAGVILTYRARINTKKLGLSHYHIFFYFDNISPEKEKRVISFIKKHPYSTYTTLCVGKPDLECDILFENHYDLHEFMKEFRFLFNDVFKKHRFLMITKLKKSTYYS